jgi:ABC-type sugar transport system ATPase subunit
VHDIESILGATPLLKRRPEALSRVQRRRVAVEREIMCLLEVFPFAEPLSSLEAKMCFEMRGGIKLLHERLQRPLSAPSRFRSQR